MIAHPLAPLREVAAHFEVTQPWLSTIIHSHAFQDQLSRRKDEVFDVAVLQGLDEKLGAAAHQTLDAYLEKVPSLTADQLISAQDKLIGRLGYGSNGRGDTHVQVNVQNNHVSGEVLEEARNRIGTNKVGEASSPAALPDKSAEVGTEIEGTLVRAESQPEPVERVRTDELHSEPMVSVPAPRTED
jgi:hypothetical protein